MGEMYQKIGRANREKDGTGFADVNFSWPARCLHRKRILGDYPTTAGEQAEEKRQDLNVALVGVNDFYRWATDPFTCRHVGVGRLLNHPGFQETLGPCGDMCDNCTNGAPAKPVSRNSATGSCADKGLAKARDICRLGLVNAVTSFFQTRLHACTMDALGGHVVQETGLHRTCVTCVIQNMLVTGFLMDFPSKTSEALGKWEVTATAYIRGWAIPCWVDLY